MQCKDGETRSDTLKEQALTVVMKLVHAGEVCSYERIVIAPNDVDFEPLTLSFRHGVGASQQCKRLDGNLSSRDKQVWTDGS